MSNSDDAVMQAKEAYALALKAGASQSAAIAAACVVYRRLRGDANEQAIRKAVNAALNEGPA